MNSEEHVHRGKPVQKAVVVYTPSLVEDNSELSHQLEWMGINKCGGSIRLFRLPC